MHSYRFELTLAALLLALFLVFSQWHTPGSKLSADEIDAYMSRLEQNLPWPAQEKGEILRHLRAWAEADDGQPVYMLNLMRFYPQLRALPEVAGFKGSPEQANAYYEEHVMPLLFARGGYPLFASTMQGVLAGEQPSTNLITFEPAIDNWSSVLVVRYPSRRAFIDLVSDAEYAKYVPYKAASLLVGLTPMKGDLILPMLSWALAAGLLILFLAVAWIRALRRAR
ncbi:hypothetical protein D3C84_123300 [compost metagenome]